MEGNDFIGQSPQTGFKYSEILATVIALCCFEELAVKLSQRILTNIFFYLINVNIRVISINFIDNNYINF
jgi:hypothetical protein